MSVTAKETYQTKGNDSVSTSPLSRFPCRAHHTRVPDRERCVARWTRRRIETLQCGTSIPSGSSSHSAPGTTPSAFTEPPSSTATYITPADNKRLECACSPHTRSSRRAGSGKDSSAFRTGHVLHLLLQYKGSRHNSMLPHVCVQRVLSARPPVPHVSGTDRSHPAHFFVKHVSLFTLRVARINVSIRCPPPPQTPFFSFPVSVTKVRDFSSLSLTPNDISANTQ